MKYGLIGKKLGYSYSKIIHGFLGNREYELVEIPPDEVEGFLLKGDFLGINVTIPYKEKVMPFCILDEAAEKIGCVNTIINRDGILYGYNTDCFGFLYTAQKAGITFAGKKVVILGSGGTSKTAAYVARDQGAKETIIVSRNGEDNYENIGRHADACILVNTTPVGMYPDNSHSPIGLDLFPGLEAVIDVVYNPLRSKLILDARRLGVKAAAGLPMLVVQAVRAHELFFGVSEIEVRQILAKTEKHFSNIVLTGMPGCGKTTIGAELARLEARDFVDTDSEIEKRTGEKVPDIIVGKGEKYFRKLESEAVAEAAARSGIVIATGGGAVLAAENRETLKQNGVIIFIDRRPEDLATTGRPLSKDIGELYRKRRPVYEEFCDYRIKITNGPDSAVAEIRKILL